MKRLTVLYDDKCSFCLRCAAWLQRQEQLIPLELIALSHPDVAHRFPGLSEPNSSSDLVVVGDNGAVYEGSKAFLICLYALKEYRLWSSRLASPELRHLARRAFGVLSKRRGTLSRLLGSKADSRLLANLTDPGMHKALKECNGRCR